MGEFKIGTRVRLKSGGPLMTVASEEDVYQPGIVSCTWFDKKNELQRDSFHQKSIEESEDGGITFGVV